MATDFSWFQVLAAAFGGGLTVKLVDIVYQEFTKRRDRTNDATSFVNQHLDPLLKSADELVGKLHSLAKQDFGPITGISIDLSEINSTDFGSLLYLIGRFWARIEIIRLEGLSVSMSKDKRGAKLQSFLACLESEKVRLVDRISQKAIGEILIRPAPDYLRNVGYLEFISMIEGKPEIRRWISPLSSFLQRLEHTANRQTMLQYAVVVHALIDTLDPDHYVTGNRPSLPGKLSEKTKKGLRYRVFKVYLPFVPNRQKYLDVATKNGKGDPL